MSLRKPVTQLTLDDFRTNPVWEFTNADEHIDETVVRPVRSIPVKSLDGRIVGVPVTLANGRQRWAMIGNVSVGDPRLTAHWLTLSIFGRGRWFPLARYFDIHRRTHGPRALAKSLGLPLSAVFPIAYNITHYAKGDPGALAGVIESEPSERLTRAQIIALAVPKRV